MSVAFRRESDEEHLEPKFELPIPRGPNRVTANGLRLIERRLAELADALANAADDDARKTIQRQQRYWATRKATAELMPVPMGDAVAFGSRVTVLMNGKKRTFDLVGDDEADPAQDRIAFTSPIARALMGSEVGDAVDFGGREGAIIVEAVVAID